MLGKVAHEPAAVNLAEQRRGFAQCHRAGSEGFEHDAVTGEFVGARHKPLDVSFVELDDVGDQEKLPRHAGLRNCCLEPLIDDALVRGVLIDNDEPIARLRDDVSVVDLRTRRAERMIELIGVRFPKFRPFSETGRRIVAHVRGRPAGVEGSLCRFGETAA